MTIPRNRLKVEVTVNGSGFENPINGKIAKTKEIPSCSLSFPSEGGRLDRYFSYNDVFRVYIGLDEILEDPIFTGTVISQSGQKNVSVSLLGLLHKTTVRNLYITDTNNYDGDEISVAIQKIVNDMVTVDTVFQGTSPARFIAKETSKRYIDGIRAYDLIKSFRDSASYVDSTTGLGYGYALSQIGDVIYFRKVPVPSETNITHELTHGDNIVSSKPLEKTLGIINRATVIGDDGVSGTFENAERIARYGIYEDKPTKNKDNTTVAQCVDQAKKLVEASMFPVITSQVSSPLLLDSIPFVSVLKLNDSPYNINGLNLITGTTIGFGTTLTVGCTLEKQVPLLTTEIVSSLISSGDYVESRLPSYLTS